MGGRAFSQASTDDHEELHVVRMSPETYVRMKAVCIQRLQDYFPGCKVQTLLEAPGKESYGDLDLIVRSDGSFDSMQLAAAIGARGVIWDETDKIRRCILAVLHDGSKSQCPPVRYYNKSNALESPPHKTLTLKEYVQVDVELIPLDKFDWYSFYSSYGDMAALLGQILHNRGFMVSDKGLSLRMQELDDFKAIQYINLPGQDGIIFLSHDPPEVMAYLGLDRARYGAGFTSQEDFFAWLSQCRLLTTHYVENMQYKRADNSTQRAKTGKRPAMSEFFRNYLPNHIDSLNAVEEADDTRKVWQELAVDHFGVREQFERMRNALVRSKRNQTAVHLLKPIITVCSGNDKPKKMNELLRAIRRWADVDSNGKPTIRHVPQSDQDSQLHRWLDADGEGFRDEKAVNDWIQEHWLELKELERGK